MLSGRKCILIPQKGDYSKESNVHTLFFETKSVIKRSRRYRTQYGKHPPSDNVVRRWLKQFQETGSVLRRKGVERMSTLEENVDRIQEAFSRSPQKSSRQDSLS
jgi:hypothetical protein